MPSRLVAFALGVAAAGLFAGCSSPLEEPHDFARTLARTAPPGVDAVPASRFRARAESEAPAAPDLPGHANSDDYVRYALYNSPQVEAAFQRWRTAAERLPQVSALPDPRLNVGFFLDEVETRVGPQQARVGLQQTFPWPGKLSDREDAASRAAMSAWRRFEAVRLSVTERIVSALYDLAYLDAAIGITRDNLDLLQSFEEVVRARYRVGAGSHPDLIRVQVALGQLEDRLIQLQAMRPSYVADLNATLNREASEPIAIAPQLPDRVVAATAQSLESTARASSPMLLALDEQVQEQRDLMKVARADGLPDFTIGLDYTFTDDAINPSMPESGDDPIFLSLGINLPLWREKYDAGVREAIARRLSVANERADTANRMAADIHRTWFEHTDGDRRVRLYERTLIPKAQESLRASLAGFRAGEISFLDLLDTERTLLEFAVASERARADRGKALARLAALVGEPIPTHPSDESSPTEVQP